MAQVMNGASLLAGLLILGATGAAEAQSTSGTPSSPAAESWIWIVAGGGFAVARGGCTECDRSGVYLRDRGWLIDGGARVNQRADAGIEISWVGSQVEDDGDPIRTTFVLGVGQFRPWLEHGLFIKAGMGVGFAGNGIYSVALPIDPPYSTNALAVVYGVGWVFKRDRRLAMQIYGNHHVAAIGELNTGTTSIRNVVGNFWTAGAGLVIR
jgi:hypothetical protein